MLETLRGGPKRVRYSQGERPTPLFLTSLPIQRSLGTEQPVFSSPFFVTALVLFPNPPLSDSFQPLREQSGSLQSSHGGFLQSNSTCIIRSSSDAREEAGRGWYYLDFTGGETKAQGGEGLRQAPRSRIWLVVAPSLNPARGRNALPPPPTTSPPAGGGGGTGGWSAGSVVLGSMLGAPTPTSCVTLDKWLPVSLPKPSRL